MASYTTRAPPRIEVQKPWLEVENQAKARTATTCPHKSKEIARWL